jgi:hypothetical protein
MIRREGGKQENGRPRNRMVWLSVGSLIINLGRLLWEMSRHS